MPFDRGAVLLVYSAFPDGRRGFTRSASSTTPEKGAIDVVLLWTIAPSVAAVMVESVGSIQREWRFALQTAARTFTVLFTAEYLLRLRGDAASFRGPVGFLSAIPSDLSAIFSGASR